MEFNISTTVISYLSFIEPELILPEFISLKNRLDSAKNRLNGIDKKKYRQIVEIPYEGIHHQGLKEYTPEYPTNAWLKFWEIANKYLDPKTNELSTLHVAEMPGSFLLSLNHFLTTKYPSLKWNWTASSYIGAGALKDEYQLKQLYENNWNFGKLGDGDITKPENIISFGKSKYDLVTSDARNDTLNYNDEEIENLSIHTGQILTALYCLKKGGIMIVKTFTQFTQKSIALNYILSMYFTELKVFKPETSRPNNSEIYLIGLNFKSNQGIKFDEFFNLFGKSVKVPKEFINEMIPIQEILAKTQIKSIENTLNFMKDPSYTKERMKNEIAQNKLNWLTKYPIIKLTKPLIIPKPNAELTFFTQDFQNQFITLCDKIQTMKKVGHKVEFEIVFGKYDDKGFKSGITLSEYTILKDNIKGQIIETCDIFYDNDIRVSVEGSNGIFNGKRTIIRKSKKIDDTKPINEFLNGSRIRMNLSTENQLTESELGNPNTIRIKKRISQDRREPEFLDKKDPTGRVVKEKNQYSGFSIFKHDLTEIRHYSSIIGKGQTNPRKTEVLLKILKKMGIFKGQTSDDPGIDREANLFLSTEKYKYECEIEIEVVSNGLYIRPGYLLSRIKSKMNSFMSLLLRASVNDPETFYKKVTNGNDFIGALPVALTQDRWKKVKKEKYFVTDKADGLRYLLINTKGVIYRVNRKFEFERTDMSPSFFEDDTIIDTEFIEDTGFYYAFDMLVYKGTDIREKKTSERLTLLKECINKNDYIHYKESLECTTENISFLLNSFRNYTKDGLIFTPDTPYVAQGKRTWTLQYKWKDIPTIDFKLVIPNMAIIPVNNINYYAVELHVNTISIIRNGKPAKVVYSDNDSYTLMYTNGETESVPKSEINKIAKKETISYPYAKQLIPVSEIKDTYSANTIVECKWSKNQNRYKIIKKIRTDKNDPNFIEIACETEMVAKNPVDLGVKIKNSPPKGSRISPPKDSSRSATTTTTTTAATASTEAPLYKPITQSIAERKNDINYPLREFSNRVKNDLIKNYCGSKDLLDLCCGQGGDIKKWINNRVKYVLGIDQDEQINGKDGAKDRLRKINKSPTEIHFLEGDLREDMRETISNYRNSFDVVSCFFGLHYFLVKKGSEKRPKSFDNFLLNVRDSLKKGGYFIGTVFDGKSVFRTLKNGDIDNDYYTIKKVECNTMLKYSNVINVTVKGGSNVKGFNETLVYYDDVLKPELEKLGFEIVESKLFEPESPAEQLLSSEQIQFLKLNRFFVFRLKDVPQQGGSLKMCTIKRENMIYLTETEVIEYANRLNTQTNRTALREKLATTSLNLSICQEIRKKIIERMAKKGLL